MTRRVRSLAFSSVLGGLAACAAGLALAGCPSTTTITSYTPITGIVIRAESLVAGHGCGTAPGQVYRYAAVLYYAPDAGGPLNADGTPVAQESGVFDCFTDGVFSNLSASETGSLSFDLTVYAFDKDAFPAALDCPPGGSAMVDAAVCPGDVPANVTAQASTAAATWTTTCTATQQSGVSVLAVCEPLVPGGGGDAGSDASDAGAGEAAVGDGGDGGPADAPPGDADDGPSDAPPGDAADAPNDADAGAPTDGPGGDAGADATSD